MSICEEIRSAIAVGVPFSAVGILARVPSVEGDRAKLSQNLSALKTEGKIRRAGILDDEAAYVLDEWPVNAEGGTVRRMRVEKPVKVTPAKPGSKAPRKPKSQPTAAKSQRKTAISLPARVEPDDNHVVALQADGSVFLLDKSDGTYQTLPGGVVQQIIHLAQLVAR